jgi:hypothetical protein
MSSAKLAVACVLAAAALSACGTTAKPVAGAASTAGKPSGRGVVDDPRKKHLQCLEQHHVPVIKVGGTDLQVGTPGSGPKISFQPTPGAAQDAQISGMVENAEVIGSALLYPNQASDSELEVIEDCLAQGVVG